MVCARDGGAVVTEQAAKSLLRPVVPRGNTTGERGSRRPGQPRRCGVWYAGGKRISPRHVVEDSTDDATTSVLIRPPRRRDVGDCRAPAGARAARHATARVGAGGACGGRRPPDGGRDHAPGRRTVTRDQPGD